MAAAGNSATDPCVGGRQTHRTFTKRRCWSWPPRATRATNRGTILLPCARTTTIHAPPPTSCSLAPPLVRGHCPISPTTALASTCRSPPHDPSCSARLQPPCACARLPAPTHPAARQAPTRPLLLLGALATCVCTGARLLYPGGLGWLKQHRHEEYQRHQHGGAACLRRRCPAARGGLDPLGGAGQGDYPRRRGGGLPRPEARSSHGYAQPPPHRRRRNTLCPRSPWTAVLAAGPHGRCWPWLCFGWVVRAEHWVRWHGLLQQRGLHDHRPTSGSHLGHELCG